MQKPNLNTYFEMIYVHVSCGFDYKQLKKYCNKQYSVKKYLTNDTYFKNIDNKILKICIYKLRNNIYTATNIFACITAHILMYAITIWLLANIFTIINIIMPVYIIHNLFWFAVVYFCAAPFIHIVMTAYITSAYSLKKEINKYKQNIANQKQHIKLVLNTKHMPNDIGDMVNEYLFISNA